MKLPENPDYIENSRQRCRWCAFPMAPRKAADGYYAAATWCPVQKQDVNDFQVCASFTPHPAVDMERVAPDGGYYRAGR